MKYRIFTLSVLILASTGLSAKELRVRAGETLLIAPTQQTMNFDTLVLGDGAKVRFAPGVTHWQLTAKHVEVGENVLIDARGEPGAAGSAGKDGLGAASDCEDGKAGGAGGAGKPGGDGISLSLSWGISELGSLQIVSDGGAGGSGGRGGQGQQGGDINKCRGGDGGSGGEGGPGGDGGNAGSVSLVYWPVSNTIDTTAIARRVAVSSAGGAPGSGGDGGSGGAAIEGRYMKGSFAGNKKWLAGGEPGRAGAMGQKGRPGREGARQVQQDFAKAARGAASSQISQGLPAVANDATVSLSQRVQRLERQLETLEARLDQLQHQPR